MNTPFKNKLENIRIKAFKPLISPHELHQVLPLETQASQNISQMRQQVCDILEGSDQRLMMVVGPCSIHDIKAAKEYAQKLKKLSQKVKESMLLIMRVYFEKPRTTTGWKGLINDPDLNDSFKLEKGLKLAREFLLYLAEQNIPAGSEALDPISPQYLDDLFCWIAIGARTTESQTHREMASGLSMPVGFKNGTDGNIGIAINAISSSKKPHRFLGVDSQGKIALVETLGNPYGHVILRGGKEPNYHQDIVTETAKELENKGHKPNLVIDCSHANSHKDYRLQPMVASDVVVQIMGDRKQSKISPIKGLMLESHLFAGRQDLPSLDDLDNSNNSTQKKGDEVRDRLDYGVSITDACLDWQKTEELILKLHTELLNKEHTA